MPALGPELRSPEELSHTEFEMVVRRLADDLAHGTDTSLFVGSGLEYAQSRPYVPGDSVRQLDSRVSARVGKPYVKQYETLKRTTVYLVVDTSASMSAASGPLAKHDLAIWVATAVGIVAQRRLSPVAVVGAGERQTRVEPSLAKADLYRSIEPLRTHAPQEQTRLGPQLAHLAARAGRTSMVLVLSDLHDPEAVPALKRIAQHHDCAVVQLQDPAELGALRAGFVRARESESGTRLLAAGRTRWLEPDQTAREIRQAGIGHLVLKTDRPFVAPLRHFLITRSGPARRGA